MKTLLKTLKHGYKLVDKESGQEVTHREVELRDYTTADMFAAEEEVPAHQTLKFNGALMARQIVRIGSFNGPFTLAMVTKLHKVDYTILRAAQLELEQQGEG